ALTVLGAMPGRVLAAIGVLGAAVLLTLGVSTVREAGQAELPATGGGTGTQSLRQGVIVNLLSPHPWLFWLSVGGPPLVTAWHHSAVHGGAFLLGFYGLLVGSKAVLAMLLGASRRWITLPWYRRLQRASGALLMAAAVALAIEFVPALTG